MDRTTAVAVSWVAQEIIWAGQTLIRIAYGWLRWAEQHASAPPPTRSRAPAEGVPENSSAGS